MSSLKISENGTQFIYTWCTLTSLRADIFWYRYKYCTITNLKFMTIQYNCTKNSLNVWLFKSVLGVDPGFNFR